MTLVSLLSVMLWVMKSRNSIKGWTLVGVTIKIQMQLLIPFLISKNRLLLSNLSLFDVSSEAA